MKEQPRANKRGPDIDVTDEQIEDALDRLFQVVKDEAMPDRWRERSEMESKVEMNKTAGFAPMGLEPKAGEVLETNPLGADGGAAKTGLFDPDLGQSGGTKPSALVPAVVRKRRQTKRRWLSAAAAAVLAGTMLFTSWGQDVMANMLNTFRVQHFETISFSESDLNGFRQALESGTIGKRQLDLRLYGEIEQSGGGTERTVEAAEAERLAGRPLKALPGADLKAIDYMPQQQLTFKLHPQEINKLLALLGGKTEFPASIDNAPIKLTLPNSFSMAVRDPKSGHSSKRLMQLPSPTLDVPDNVDVEQIRQAVLDLPMLPDDLRSKLAAIGDWRTTLPVPSMDGENIRTVSIGGHDAIVSSKGYSRTMIWLENDWMYVLSGSAADYPSEEDMIKEAKGLME